MKIGLSLSRCLKDVVAHKIEPAEILVIVTGTYFKQLDDEAWQSLWSHYAPYSWPTDIAKESVYKETLLYLWETGRIHQPRAFGGTPPESVHYHWVELGPSAAYLDSSPVAVKNAWNHFAMLKGLHGDECQD